MDSDHFDAIIRRLSMRLPRRTLLGPALGSTLGLSLFTQPEAKKRKRRKKKKKPPTACTPNCAGVACGANDGCGRPCQTGTCPTNQDCQQGQCVARNACDPPCPSGRDCFQGDCTCTSSGQCANDRDPNGFDCVSAPGNPLIGICGCANSSARVCTAGQPCSTCCADLDCQAIFPGDDHIICATIPVDTLVGRSCCHPPGSPCSSACCSGFCSGTVCGGFATGHACGQNEQCQSRQCGTPTTPNACA